MRIYLIDDVKVDKKTFIKEVLYNLYLEKVTGIEDKSLTSNSRLNMVTLMAIILSNESKSSFFEVGHIVVKTYESVASNEHIDIWMDWKYDVMLPIDLYEGDKIKCTTEEYTVIGLNAPEVRVVDSLNRTGNVEAYSITRVLRKKV